MCIAPFTYAEIKCLDSLLTRAAKQAYKLSVSLSTAAAHMPKEKGGLGCYSLEADHAIICIQRLCRALENPGPLGVISKALFDLQKQGVNKLAAQQRPHTIRYCMRIRQAMVYQTCGYRLCRNGTTHDDIAAMDTLATSLQPYYLTLNSGTTEWWRT